MRNKQKWNQVIDLIHVIEDKYGSIHQTPRSDPDFQRIHELLSVGNATRVSALTKVSKSKQGIIVSKVAQGHTKNYVMHHCHVSSFVLDQILSAYAVQFIPRFVYILHKPGEKDFYFRSKLKDIPIFFDLPLNNSRQVNTFLETSGWKLIVKKTIWDDVPIGAKYISRSHKILVKTTDNIED